MKSIAPGYRQNVAVFRVTIQKPESRATVEIEAANYFTAEHWVTFWSAGNLPHPVFRFPREHVVAIELALPGGEFLRPD